MPKLAVAAGWRAALKLAGVMVTAVPDWVSVELHELFTVWLPANENETVQLRTGTVPLFVTVKLTMLPVSQLLATDALTEQLGLPAGGEDGGGLDGGGLDGGGLDGGGELGGGEVGGVPVPVLV